MEFTFSAKNAISLDEGVRSFVSNENSNLIDSITIGINPDKSESVINNAVAGPDPLAKMLINNAIANMATLNVDGCKSDKERWYIQTPYIINDTPIGANDDGTGCCVNLNAFQGCRYKLGINELCVKDCVSTTLDEMAEKAVEIKAIDTKLPNRAVGDSLAEARRKRFAATVPYVFERNVILGTPTFSGDGMRPFDGVVSRLMDARTIKLDGQAGALASIAMLECRLNAIGGDVRGFVAAVNPILLPTLRQEVRTYLKSDPLTEWRLTPNGVSYNGLRIVPSRYVDVDLETNTTSIWLIDTRRVGIKLLYSPYNPYIKDKNGEGDCDGHCVTAHTAGTTVVTDWSGLALVKNVGLNSICNSYALTGLDGFVNSGTIGTRYPKVTSLNPGMGL